MALAGWKASKRAIKGLFYFFYFFSGVGVLVSHLKFDTGSVCVWGLLLGVQKPDMCGAWIASHTRPQQAARPPTEPVTAKCDRSDRQARHERRRTTEAKRKLIGA